MKKQSSQKKHQHHQAIKTGTPWLPTVFFGFLIVLLPLVYLTSALDPSLMPQLFVQSVVLFAFTFPLFLKKNTHSDWFSLFRQPLFWLVVAYSLVTFLSSLVAVNYKESLFDISKTITFVLVVTYSWQYLSTTEVRNRLPLMMLIANIIALSIGFHQYLNLVLPVQSPTDWSNLPPIYQVKGLMAHKNLYASSLFMMLPLLAVGAMQQKKQLRWLFVISILLTFFMIYLLSTRAVWLGVLAAFGTILAGFFLFQNSFQLPRKIRNGMFIGSIFGLIALIALLAKSNYENSLSFADRFQSIFNPKDPNNLHRLHVWDVSMHLVKEHPITGVGAGNWKIISPKYYHLHHFTKEQLNWVRPHNDFLWVLTEKGIIGLLVFLGIFAAALLRIALRLRQNADKQEHYTCLFLAAGLIGYLVISFFDFPLERIWHQSVLAVWLAIILTAHRQSTEPSKTPAGSMALPLLLLLFTSIYAASATRLEQIVQQTRKAQFSNDWAHMLSLAQSIPTRFRNLDAEAMPIYYYHGLASERLNKPAEAKKFYEKALEDFPTKVQVMNNLGLACFNLGEFEEAKSYFEKARQILPDYTEATVNLSAVYDKEKKYRKSLQMLREVPKERWDDRYFKREEYLIKKIKEQDEKRKNNTASGINHNE